MKRLICKCGCKKIFYAERKRKYLDKRHSTRVRSKMRYDRDYKSLGVAEAMGEGRGKRRKT